MRALVVVVAVGCLSADRSIAASADAWIVQPPSSISRAKSEQKIAVDFYEVVASMMGNAESELQKKALVRISEAQARHFGGQGYSCPKGKMPYLVRAPYGFAGTGRFRVVRIGEALWVSHESLGPEFVSQRSALIVNLESEPSVVYATVSIAR